MTQSDKIIEKLEKTFATANLNAISIVKEALAEDIDIKLISEAILQGVEKAERSSLGGIVFQGTHILRNPVVVMLSTPQSWRGDCRITFLPGKHLPPGLS